MSRSMIQLPSDITAVVRRLRRQIRNYVWLEGLAVVLIWIGIAFWLGLALDYLPVLAGANELPRAARAVLLSLFALVLVYLVYRLIIRRAFVPLSDRSLALLLERKFPELNDALVTAVDTPIDADDGQTAKLQRSMLQHTIDVAASRTGHVQTSQALRYGPLWRKSLMALIAFASVAIFAALAGEAFATWTSRLFLVSDAPWPRRAQIEVLGFESGHRRVAEGSDLTIRVRAAANRPTPPPLLCTIDYRLPGGDHGRVNMSRDGEPRDGYQFYRYEGPPFQSMFEQLDFDVIGFDHRVSDLRVEVVPRPSITEVRLDCDLPEYLNQPSRELVWRPGINLPVGTRIQLRAEATKPLRKIVIDHLEAGRQEELTPVAAESPRSFRYEVGTLETSTTLELTLLDYDDVTSEKAYRVSINALEDLPPKLDVQLRGIGSAITPEARLPIAGNIRDDYGIREAWFQLTREDASPPLRQTFQVDTEGAVETALDLRQQRNEDRMPWPVNAGDQVVLTVHASDFFDLDSEPHEGQIAPIALDVVTPQELLALLEARELNLKRRFEQIISELTETRDSLLTLQANLAGPADSAGELQSGELPAEDLQTNVDSSTRDSTLRRLRVQRAQQQGSKSQQEVQGVAASFAEIRDEQVNNRVDTPERQRRLQEQIIAPLEIIVADDFSRWLDRLAQLETQVELVSPESIQLTAATIQQTNELILTLQQVLESMLELETFNELLDLVRSILGEQERLLQATEDERKRQARALLED